MSGDVQPRRRKDKKKKRDGINVTDSDKHIQEGVSSGEENAPAAAEPQWAAPSGGEWMHAQSDHGTGGHWCAKIIFFLLLAVLVTLISLIILENRGLQDLEERDAAESRYAAVFDGWLEEEHHDDHHDPHTLELKHPEEHEDDDEHPSDLEDDIEEIEKDEDSKENDDHDDHDDHDDDDDGEHDDNDDDDDHDDDDDDDDHEDDGDDDESDHDEKDNDEIEDDSDEEDHEDRNEADDKSDEANNDQDEDDDDDNNTDEGTDDDDDGIDDDYITAERRVTIEYVRYDKPLEEVDDDDNTEEVIDNHAAEEEHLSRIAAEQDDDLETSNMGLKFGVGVALVVVAHWVLVRKWRNDRNNETADGSGSDGRRRLTLIEDGEEPENSVDSQGIRKSAIGGSFSSPRSSKSAVSFAQNIETLDEEPSNGDDSEDLSEDEAISKRMFNVLTSDQCKTLVQSSLIRREDDEEKQISEDDEQEEEEEEDEEVEIVEKIKINTKDITVPDRELISDDEDVEEEANDNEDYEHIDEEEENVEEEQQDAEEDISDVDDDELMKKLEQKYGKLPAEKS